MTNIINGQTAPITGSFVEGSLGEVVYYCKPTVQGTGDGLSWQNASTFKTAVSRCTGTKPTRIILAGGLHDTGSDAGGVTIDKNYVYVLGTHAENAIGQESRIINSAGSVTTLLKITSNYCTIEGVDFDNSDQTDKNIVMLEVSGSYNVVSNCLFRQLTGDPGGTGIKMSGGVSLTINNCRFRRCVDYGVEIANASRAYCYSNKFAKCGKGIYLSNANSDQSFWNTTEFLGCTTGIDGATCPTKEHYFIDATFANCTTNAASYSNWASGLWLENIKESGKHRSVYPLFANGLGNAGIAVAGHATAFNWGNITQLIPTATINYPFFIQALNATSWSDAGVYQVELFYGDTAGDTSLGVYELVLGSTVTPQRASTPININIAIPARSYVGAKLAGSTAGPDTVYLSLGYETL